MTVRTILGAGAAVLALGATSAFADGPVAKPAKVADFTLADQNGQNHELYGLKDAKVVVLVTQGDGCPIVRNIGNTLRTLQAKYEPMGVKFLMVNSNLQDSREDVAQEAKDWGYNMPILLDAKQKVGEALDFTRTAEVFVFNPKTWSIVYRGPVDDRVTYERQKNVAQNPWASQAIDAAMAGKTVAMAQRDPQGCLINFPNRVAGQAAPSGG